MVNIKVILFIGTLLFWIILAGSVDAPHLLLGVILGILVTYFSRDIFSRKINIFKNPKRYVWFLYYIAVFAWECIKANLDGAYRLMHPNLPIKPGIVKVKTTLSSDIGLTFLANAITLKPGTMTVDIDKEKGLLYVHWVDVKSQDQEQATILIAQKFERILKRIFA